MQTVARLMLLTALLAVSQVSRAQLDCDSVVTINGGAIEVAATAGDDGANIQCALEAAARNQFGSVVLTSPEYSISSNVFVDGFTGELRGRSIASTRLVLQDFSLSCDEDRAGALSFSNGFGTTIRFMTVDVGTPCTGVTGELNVIQFITDPANCGDRTTFGTVDRVAIRGLGIDGGDFVNGVNMFAASGCDQRILGTLKVNRSTFESLDIGVVSGIGGNGQVDINFNMFTTVGIPIALRDAGQSTTILGNEIEYNNAEYSAEIYGRIGIVIASSAESPEQNSTTIKNNVFRNLVTNISGIGVAIEESDKAIDHNVVITGNVFFGAPNGVPADIGAGILTAGTNGGVISGNSFSGGTRAWVAITPSASARSTVSRWSVVGNDFSQSTADVDIQLQGVTSSVIGRSQGNPTYLDSSGENDILEGIDLAP
ncbi:MAG: hypothetical protein AAGI88_17320 [Pseudomonadota bacterium]